MKGPARPLRFVALALALWIGGRIALVMPHGNPAQMTSPRVSSPENPPAAPLSRAFATAAPFSGTPGFSGRLMPSPARIPQRPAKIIPSSGSFSSFPPPMMTAYARSAVPLSLPPPPIAAPRPEPGRLTGYGWAFVRASGGAAGLADNGQLGGSQAGFRLDYALGDDPASGLRISGRVSAALEAPGREVAIGIGWKPGRNIPVTLTIERRIAIDKAGRNAFAASAASGIGPVPLPADLALDAYAQAGVVGAKRRDGFIDGAMTLTRPVIQSDTLSLSLGAGAWGAAQPGVSRLDAGPRARVRIDTGKASIGIALDWRQRIAGDAAPGSGLALTIDSSF